MTREDGDDSHTVGAPLITPGAADTFTLRQEIDRDQAEELLSSDSGSSFMWALTLSACISGLLFGYEYVSFLSYLLIMFELTFLSSAVLE